jgi:xylitol oxidase
MKLLPQIETRLAPFGARPHWAKVFTMKSSHVAPLYPRIEDFRALAKEFDPKGKFQNAYLHNHVNTA